MSTGDAFQITTVEGRIHTFFRILYRPVGGLGWGLGGAELIGFPVLQFPRSMVSSSTVVRRTVTNPATVLNIVMNFSVVRNAVTNLAAFRNVRTNFAVPRYAVTDLATPKYSNTEYKRFSCNPNSKQRANLFRDDNREI